MGAGGGAQHGHGLEEERWRRSDGGVVWPAMDKVKTMEFYTHKTIK